MAGVEEPGNPPQGSTMSISVLSKSISEADFVSKVIARAQARGWLVYHARPARRTGGGWSTPFSGDAGFPDLVICREGITIMAECKSQKGKLREDQRRWLYHGAGHLWRPSDWPAICDLLDEPRRSRIRLIGKEADDD